jgi:ABC-type nitrate/sulfonate/bicarbonate transport system substrate-binding protein
MNRRSFHLLMLLTLTVLLSLSFLGCGDGSASDTTAAPATEATTSPQEGAAQPQPASGEATKTKVDLIMDWVPWVLDIPIDVAQSKGFYTAEGLEVTQTLPAGPTDVIKFVSTGKSQFGLYYAPDILMGVAEGAPLLSLASLMPHAPVGLAFKKGLEVDSPKVLEGKTAAVPLIPSVRASYESMLIAGGVDNAKVNLADPGFNLVQPLLTGTYDAVAFTEFAELVEAEAAGGDLDYLDFRDWGTPDYAFLNVVTSRDFAAKEPATVKSFLRATLKGLDYAIANPEEAAGIYSEAHPELGEDLLLAQWKAAVPSLTVAGEDGPAGWQDVAVWQSLAQWMTEAGLLTKPADPAQVVDNGYLQ